MHCITASDLTMAEALSEIDKLPEINRKQKNCLRLLTEEMYAMIGELLKSEKLDFEICHEGWTYRLRVSVNTNVSLKARDEFLSLSSDGRNAANKGVRGILGAIIETFAFKDDPEINNATWMYSVTPESETYIHMWSLSHFMDVAPQEKRNRSGMAWRNPLSRILRMTSRSASGTASWTSRLPRRSHKALDEKRLSCRNIVILTAAAAAPALMPARAAR